jgi:hypothetical protein
MVIFFFFNTYDKRILLNKMYTANCKCTTLYRTATYRAGAEILDDDISGRHDLL